MVSYKHGVKYCRHCGTYMYVNPDVIKCPLCNRPLRSRPRWKRHDNAK